MASHIQLYYTAVICIAIRLYSIRNSGHGGAGRGAVLTLCLSYGTYVVVLVVLVYWFVHIFSHFS